MELEKSVGLVIRQAQRDFVSGPMRVSEQANNLARVAKFIDMNYKQITHIALVMINNGHKDAYFNDCWVKPEHLRIRSDTGKDVPDTGRFAEPFQIIDTSVFEPLMDIMYVPDRIMVLPRHCVVGTRGHLVDPILLPSLNKWSKHHGKKWEYVDGEREPVDIHVFGESPHGMNRRTGEPEYLPNQKRGWNVDVLVVGGLYDDELERQMNLMVETSQNFDETRHLTVHAVVDTMTRVNRYNWYTWSTSLYSMMTGRDLVYPIIPNLDPIDLFPDEEMVRISPTGNPHVRVDEISQTRLDYSSQYPSPESTLNRLTYDIPITRSVFSYQPVDSLLDITQLQAPTENFTLRYFGPSGRGHLPFFGPNFLVINRVEDGRFWREKGWLNVCPDTYEELFYLPIEGETRHAWVEVVMRAGNQGTPVEGKLKQALKELMESQL
jgi:hypothetical protein